MARDERNEQDEQPKLNREQRRHGAIGAPTPPPPSEPRPETNPALSEQPRDSYAGRADQDVTNNTGTGAGGATEWGGGVKNHPSRISGKPPGT